jgi:hypothetical protein
MIAGVTNPFAVHAGFEMLRASGSAADATLTTALAQVALNVGATVSYAGDPHPGKRARRVHAK